MNTLTRDDTEHGKEYVLKSEADAIEAERATLWTRCRDIEAKLVTQQAISAEWVSPNTSGLGVPCMSFSTARSWCDVTYT